ncbi:type VII secretion target, partial [Mycobacterium xenopi]
MAELNVNPADLLRIADAYSELAARAAQIPPEAVVEVQRIAQTHGPMGYPTAVGVAAGLANAEGPLNAKAAEFQAYSQRFTEHAATYTTTDGAGAEEYAKHIRFEDINSDQTTSDQPKPAPDPRNPFVGDERFGHWQDVVPPPYVGNPPPPWTGHRPMHSMPSGGSTGFYMPGGKTWADDNAPPFGYLQEQYQFRISGEDYTSYTRTMNGHQQQWVQYTYEAQKITQINVGGEVWTQKGPNETTGELGGVSTGGIAGINPPPNIGQWEPITLHDIASLSVANPTVTYYMPDICGKQFAFINGVATGGYAPPPVA